MSHNPRDILKRRPGDWKGKFDDAVKERLEFLEHDSPKLQNNYKADQDKIRYDLIPPEAMDAMAEGLKFGATKYADRDWEKGLRWSQMFRALMSHAWKWWRGIPADDESGLSHMVHCLCCCAFLVAYERRKIGEDNRVKDIQQRD